MINRLRTVLLKDVVGLSVFLAERIDPDAVMLKKLAGFHVKKIRQVKEIRPN